MRSTLYGLACLALATSVSGAQRVAIETLADVELWKTDDSSRLLARNGGHVAAEGRLRAWVSWQASPSVSLLAIGTAQGGSAYEERWSSEFELAELRFAPSRALVLEGGKILLPIGSFGARRFSNTNPLIGVPDTYPTEYPWGASLSGAVGRFDYRAALVSLPAVNVEYTPVPDHRLRPDLGLGVSLGPGLRLGASWTRGPYLGSGVSSRVPSGHGWDEYQQTVTGIDVHYSVGYVEARGELMLSSYDVPGHARPIDGSGWYGEARWTLSPRFFVATRFENYDYPFVLPVSRSLWVGTTTREMNGEAGIGYRLSADVLVKTSLRKDHWPVQVQSNGQSFPDGYALAMQLSVHTDIMSLFDAPY